MAEQQHGIIRPFSEHIRDYNSEILRLFPAYSLAWQNSLKDMIGLITNHQYIRLSANELGQIENLWIQYYQSVTSKTKINYMGTTWNVSIALPVTQKEYDDLVTKGAIDLTIYQGKNKFNISPFTGTD